MVHHEVQIQLPNQAAPIKVKFPFEPYSVQVDIMTGTLKGLFGGRNALIESPTGTGKTQALLCAASAFVLHQKLRMRQGGGASGLMMNMNNSNSNKNPDGVVHTNNNSSSSSSSAFTNSKVRIVYASRTHSQLAQVVREFKACPYSKVLQMAVLGSREHLCVHSTVNSLPTSSAQNAACNALRAERGCRYFHGTSNFIADEQMEVQSEQQRVLAREKEERENHESDGNDNNNNNQEQASPSHPQQVGLHDIEELGNLGRTVGFCPYFYERDIAETADIVFLPYSYIFDPQVSSQLPFSLDNCSLILDEAHNVPSYLAASKCLTLTPRDTGSAVQDCTKAFTHVENQIQGAADGTNSLDAATLHSMKADMDDFAALKMFIIRLEQEISKVILMANSNSNNNSNASGEQHQHQQHQQPSFANSNNNNNTNNREVVKPGIHMLQWLSNCCCNFTAQTWVLMSDTITRAIGRLNESGASVIGLTKLNDFFSNVFSTPQDDLTSKTTAYRFVCFPFEPQQQQNNNQNQNNNNASSSLTSRNCLGFWCLDCSVAMNEISQRVSSMILASGTLSPMPHFAAELGVPFPITVQGNHVIKNNQLLSMVIRRGPGGVDLNSSYTNRNNTDYSKQLGLSLVSLAQTVPDGMIVFFPSYAAMNSALDAWKNRPVLNTNNNLPNNNANTNNNNNINQQQQQQPPNSAAQQQQTIWGMLSEVKPIHVEPRDTAEANSVVKEYRKAIDGVDSTNTNNNNFHQQKKSTSSSSRGAILLAVCRGKISEGLDFADRHGRCVVVTGLPFAHHGDLFVRLKKTHITSVAPHRPRVDGKLFTGDDWYKNEAMRAVNQAVGRVIRHKDDYGCVVLADDRFASHIRALSGWVRKDNVVCSQFADAYQRSNTFFHDWKVAEAAKRDREAADKKKKYLEEKRRLLGLMGKTSDNNDEDEDLFGDNDADASSTREITEDDISRLAGQAAEKAALALREKKKKEQIESQQNNNNNNNFGGNSVLIQMMGRNASSNGSDTNKEQPAPVALRSRSIFQKSTLAKPTHASVNRNLIQQHQLQQDSVNNSENNNNSNQVSRNIIIDVDNDDNQKKKVENKNTTASITTPAKPNTNTNANTNTGTNAAEFCERLKRLISAEQYQDFRNKLKDLLQHQRNYQQQKEGDDSNNNAQQQNIKNNKKEEFISVFRSQVQGMQSIFELAADSEQREQLMIDFGCFVPVNLRPMYSEMINRRRGR